MAELKTIAASAEQTYTEGVAGTDTQYISKFTLPDGSTKYVKDALARQTIANIKDAIDGGTHFLGVTTTALVDGSGTNPVVIEGKEITAKKGDFVIKADSDTAGTEPFVEFIWTGDKWSELGSTGQLKSLAYKSKASCSYTPAGTIEEVAYTPQGSVAVTTYTPAGTVSAITYTPTGTINAPAVNVTPTKSGISYIESATYTDGTETLTLSLMTATFMTGATAALAAAPTFSGTTKTLSTTFSGTTATNIAAKFTGTAATLSTTFSGTTATITVE